MDMMEAVRSRHAVRSYTDRRIEGDVLQALRDEVDACNRAGELHMQLTVDEPKAFGGLMARYGNFENVRNYLALVGRKGPDLDERLGYYGQRVVLRAQQLGLNSCWVASTFSRGKSRCDVAADEKLALVVALGYGTTQGKARKSKTFEQVAEANGDAPAWFRRGVEAALLAPTALNQQKFSFELLDAGDATPNGLPNVSAKAMRGPYSHVDLGIAKLHFEVGAGTENFAWA